MNKQNKVAIGVGLLALVIVAVVLVARGRNDELASIRNATAQYRELDTAIAGGYEPFLECMSDPAAGAMGYHYVNFAILDTTLDPLRPEAVIYEENGNGTMELVAVEYVVPVEAWDGAGHANPPTLLDQTFGRNDELGVYALHAWVWRDNPSGVFAGYNPDVSCPEM